MSANRVYLLGAGFSIAVSAGLPGEDRMPGMLELSNLVLDLLKHTIPRRSNLTTTEERAFESFKQLASVLEKSEQRERLRETYEAAMAMLSETYVPGAGTPLTKNFEQWLSYLIETPPWLTQAEQTRNRAAFLEVSTAVASVLESRERSTLHAQNGTCPDWLAKLVQMWHKDAATVITFNYDRFVELAWLVNVERTPPRTMSWDLYPAPLTPLAARAGIAPPVYSVPGGFQLFKLHGSIGWWYSGPDGPPGDIIYDQGMQGGSWSSDGLDPVGELSISLMQDREQLIVPPAAVKSPYYNNRAIRAMWRTAAGYLGLADELVIIGFSLPATDMLVSSMLCTNVRKDCMITPVDFGDAVIKRIRETFDIGADDARLNKKYVGLGENAIPSWVEDIVSVIE